MHHSLHLWGKNLPPAHPLMDDHIRVNSPPIGLWISTTNIYIVGYRVQSKLLIFEQDNLRVFSCDIEDKLIRLEIVFLALISIVFITKHNSFEKQAL